MLDATGTAAPNEASVKSNWNAPMVTVQLNLSHEASAETVESFLLHSCLTQEMLCHKDRRRVPAYARRQLLTHNRGSLFLARHLHE